VEDVDDVCSFSQPAIAGWKSKLAVPGAFRCAQTVVRKISLSEQADTIRVGLFNNMWCALMTADTIHMWLFNVFVSWRQRSLHSSWSCLPCTHLYYSSSQAMRNHNKTGAMEPLTAALYIAVGTLLGVKYRNETQDMKYQNEA
jgi:hypothetical protein